MTNKTAGSSNVGSPRDMAAAKKVANESSKSGSDARQAGGDLAGYKHMDGEGSHKPAAGQAHNVTHQNPGV